MKPNRRGFLGMLGAAIAGATIDPDRLLWVPGRKLISIPKLSEFGVPFEFGDPSLQATMDAFAKRYIQPAIDELERAFMYDAKFLYGEMWDRRLIR